MNAWTFRIITQKIVCHLFQHSHVPKGGETTSLHATVAGNKSPSVSVCRKNIAACNKFDVSWQQSYTEWTAGLFWATCCAQQMYMIDISYDTLCNLLRCCSNKVA